MLKISLLNISHLYSISCSNHPFLTLILFFRLAIVLQISKRSRIRDHVALQHETDAERGPVEPVTMESTPGTNIRSSRPRSSAGRGRIGQISARYIGRPFLHVSHRRWQLDGSFGPCLPSACFHLQPPRGFQIRAFQTRDGRVHFRPFCSRSGLQGAFEQRAALRRLGDSSRETGANNQMFPLFGIHLQIYHSESSVVRQSDCRPIRGQFQARSLLRVRRVEQDVGHTVRYGAPLSNSSTVLGLSGVRATGRRATSPRGGQTYLYNARLGAERTASSTHPGQTDSNKKSHHLFFVPGGQREQKSAVGYHVQTLEDSFSETGGAPLLHRDPWRNPQLFVQKGARFEQGQ